jgi:hypothetical protein
MARFKQESRYRGATVTQIEVDGDLRDYVVLRKPLDVPEGDEDKYIVLDQSNQFRPDIISFQVYGTPDFGWAIMEVNNLRSFVELTRGVRLRVPPLTAITEAISESNNV